MTLNVFVKRAPGGHPILDGTGEPFAYSHQFYEARDIHVSNEIDDHVAEFLLCYDDGEPVKIGIDLRTHGYEIRNKVGVVIDRTVISVSESQEKAVLDRISKRRQGTA